MASNSKRCRKKIRRSLSCSLSPSLLPFAPSVISKASRVHSRYVRQVADLPWAGVRTRLHLNVRRFFCDNRACTRRVFAERLGAELSAYARRTTRLVEALRNIAFTGGGESGARLAHAQGMPAKPRTLLRLLQADLVPQLPPSRVVGIDEWAWKKGRTYGTILVDLEQKRPVDLLPDREVKSVAAWFERIQRLKSSLVTAVACTLERLSKGRLRLCRWRIASTSCTISLRRWSDFGDHPHTWGIQLA